MTWGATSSDWSSERRKKQSEAIRKWKPWLNTVGPRTPEGKARSAARSLKHGRRSANVHNAGAVTACIDRLARELE